MAGGVDVATRALSEGKALVRIRASCARSAYMHRPADGRPLPDVPLTSENLDSGWTLAAFSSTVSGPEASGEHPLLLRKRAAM